MLKIGISQKLHVIFQKALYGTLPCLLFPVAFLLSDFLPFAISSVGLFQRLPSPDGKKIIFLRIFKVPVIALLVALLLRDRLQSFLACSPLGLSELLNKSLRKNCKLTVHSLSSNPMLPLYYPSVFELKTLNCRLHNLFLFFAKIFNSFLRRKRFILFIFINFK